MSDSKPHQFRPPLYSDDDREQGRDRNAAAPSNGENGREQQGWDAYRKWLSSVSGKSQTRRATIDHSIYSWKGYQNWADRVRQNWNPDEN